MGTLGLDLSAGAALAATEKYGDWYRDPWGWPELTTSYVKDLDVEADVCVALGSRGEYHLTRQPFFHLIDVPKTRLGVRPAVVQDPLSRLAYLTAACSGLGSLHASLPDWVYGWRQRANGVAASGGQEWKAYVACLPEPDPWDYGLVTDITSFFASIRPERLEQVVYGRMGRVTASHIIMDVVRAHDALSTRSGLPQRSFASAILAHAVLQPVDDALDAALATSGVTAVRRWMDDISAEGAEGALFTLLLNLQERARQVGLELNSSKTHLSPGDITAHSLRLDDLKEIRVPMAARPREDYSDEIKFEPDLNHLLKLEDEMLKDPTKVARTPARAVLLSLAANGQFSRHEEWRKAASALPHAADAIGRYLRDSAGADPSLWTNLGDWFNAYQASPWGRLHWVSSQFALIFPASQMPTSVMTVLQEWLENSPNLQQVAIAAQRVCTANPVIGRNIIRGRVDRTADPLLLRVLALGLLLAEDNQAAVEAVLTRDPRNHLLKKYLESRRWRPPIVAKDFDSSAADSDN